MRLSASALAQVTGGTLVGQDVPFGGISIDSRRVAAGDLFVAIVGERHDAHEFLPQAMANAVVGLVSRADLTPPAGKALVVVPDTVAALQALGRHVRDTLSLTVVGITGSVGKTTTKELTAAVLSRRFRTARSSGNFNNAIGLPLEVARLAEGTEVAVLEMGMSTPGEIRLLSQLFRPDVGVVTAVAPVHLQNFASLDDIMEAKGEILAGMPAAATFVANADDPRSMAIGKRHRGALLTYGFARGADVTATDLAEDGGAATFVLHAGDEGAAVELPLPGRHNVSNFLAAAAVGLALGVSADEAAAAARRVQAARHRGEVRRLASGVLLYDDSYNSSPTALAASYAAFERAARGRRKVAVIGEMLELGPTAAELHRQAGKQLAKRFDLLLAVRGHAAALAEGAREGGGPEEAVRLLKDVDEAIAVVPPLLASGDALFVKGSRGVALDRLVDALTVGDANGESR